MEDVLFWGLVLAGVVIGFLVTMLFASERELKAKNQRLAELESKPSSGTEFNQAVDQGGNPVPELEREIEDLTEKNDRLQEEILELKQRLEQHKERAEHLVATQERLMQIEMQSADLQRQNNELEDRSGELCVKLQESEEKAQQLEIVRSQLVELQSQHQRAQEENAQLQTEVEALKLKVAENEKKLPEHEEMQKRLAHVEVESRETQSDNEFLRKEVSELETGLAASRERIQELETLEVGLQEPDSQKENIHIETDAEVIPGGEPHALPVAQDLVKIGQYPEAIAQLEAFLADNPNHREARLLHLLASIRHYNVYGYEKQIQAIKDLPDLSESERTLAGDIFLFAAREAENRDRMDEARAFKACADQLNAPSSTIHSVSTGSAQDQASQPTVPGINGYPSVDQTGAPSDADAPATIPLAASEQSIEGNSNAWKAAARIVVGVVLALVLAGTLASGFWRRSQKESPASETTSAPVATEPSETVQTEPAKDDAGDAPAIQTAQREDVKDTLAPAETEATKQAAEPAEEKPSRATQVTAKKSSRQTAASKPKPESLASVSSKTSNRSPAAGEKQRKSSAKRPVAAEKSVLSWGKYEVIHPTKVYSKPNEQSEAVASIDVGIKVNVVDVRDNWLEIRSKFGRPPGFIKKESAMPLAAQ